MLFQAAFSGCTLRKLCADCLCVHRKMLQASFRMQVMHWVGRWHFSSVLNLKVWAYNVKLMCAKDLLVSLGFLGCHPWKDIIIMYSCMCCVSRLEHIAYHKAKKKKWSKRTSVSTCACTHACTHALTHSHTDSVRYLEEVRFQRCECVWRFNLAKEAVLDSMRETSYLPSYHYHGAWLEKCWVHSPYGI